MAERTGDGARLFNAAAEVLAQEWEQQDQDDGREARADYVGDAKRLLDRLAALPEGWGLFNKSILIGIVAAGQRRPAEDTHPWAERIAAMKAN